MPAGRPSLYKPEYCDDVIRMGKEGYSVVEMAAEIGVSRPTIEETWPEKHPTFFEAFTYARLCSQAWWERAGRVGMIENNISAPIWSRSMAARFPRDWREVKGTELTGKDGGPVEATVARIERVIVDPVNNPADKDTP